MGDPKFLGWVDASEEGIGSGWIPVKDALEPKIWLFEWPNKLRSRLVTPKNPGGDLDINDLEMTGKLLAWLVLEGIIGSENPHYKHAEIFSNNTTEVSWTQRGAKKVRSSRKSA